MAEEDIKLFNQLQQDNLKNYFFSLDEMKKKDLLDQIYRIDEKKLCQQRAIIFKESEPSCDFEPLEDFIEYGNPNFYEQGLEVLKNGCCGCLIVAGGQASRLGIGVMPKGKYLVSPFKQKSLFQLFVEKTKAASKLASKPLFISIMTSKLNHDETLDFFKDNQFFGYDPFYIDFFIQDSLPFLDESGHLILEDETKIAEGPDGNGFALKKFYDSKIWHKWKSFGVKYINFCLVDNPLLDPFDRQMLGAIDFLNKDIIIKAVKRIDPNECVGLIVQNKGKVLVKEYIEISDEEKKATTSDGSLKYKLANISFFTFSMDFIENAANKFYEKMFLHAAKKKIKAFTKERFAWKFESFIFDILPFSDNILTIVQDRASTFAPLKNLNGPDSIETVRLALKKKDKDTICAITGLSAPTFDFELAQDFYYPTDEILAKWKGKKLPNSLYIEP